MIRCRLDFICRATSSGIFKKPAFFREAKKSKNLKFYFYKSNEIYCKQGRFIEGSILALESMFLSSGMANKAGERTSLRFLEIASLQMCLFVQISTMTRLQSLKVAILWAWFSYCLFCQYYYRFCHKIAICDNKIAIFSHRNATSGHRIVILFKEVPHLLIKLPFIARELLFLPYNCHFCYIRSKPVENLEQACGTTKSQRFFS